MAPKYTDFIAGGQKMKAKFQKASCVLCSAALLLGALSGCTKKATPTSKADTSKSVQLQVYLVGDAPKGLDKVSDKINELSKKDINATVKFSFTTWTDYANKYNLLISSGEPIDLLYTAPWLSYGSYAQKGAFMSLNTLLPKYAPELYKFVSQNDWKLCELNGKIYTMPSTYKEYFSDELIYREDLRKKYNLPVPDTFEKCEQYMLGIKKNMPSQMITNTTGSSFLFLKDNEDSLETQNYGMQFNYYHPTKITQYWGSNKFLTNMKDIKRWADEGLWSKSILSDKTDSNDFNNGKIVISAAGINPSKYIGSVSKIKQTHPDWEVGFVQGAENVDYSAFTNHPLTNGFAIPVTSKNPERALMFYQKLVLDKTYNQLSEYGIQGVDYTVENGQYKQIGDSFGYEGMNGWSWRNPQYMLKTSDTDALNTVFDSLSKVVAKHPAKYSAKITDGFSEDTTSYENELAAVNTVVTQYLNPLLHGEVDDVDQATSIFMTKVKAAGLEKVQQGWQKQWLAYCKQYGYTD